MEKQSTPLAEVDLASKPPTTTQVNEGREKNTSLIMNLAGGHISSSFRMDSVMWARLAAAARWTLAAELLVGGQARLTRRLTPGLHDQAMAKARGYLEYLRFIPASSPSEHSFFIGVAMCTAGGLLCFPATRMQGALLSSSLSLMGIYSQARMGVPYWLPCINTVLGSFIAYSNVISMK